MLVSRRSFLRGSLAAATVGILEAPAYGFHRKSLEADINCVLDTTVPLYNENARPLGTGFLYKGHGNDVFVSTNYHNLINSSNRRIVGTLFAKYNQKDVELKEIYTHYGLDLAIFSGCFPDANPPLEKEMFEYGTNAVFFGDRIVIVGCQNGISPTIRSGLVINPEISDCYGARHEQVGICEPFPHTDILALASVGPGFSGASAWKEITKQNRRMYEWVGIVHRAGPFILEEGSIEDKFMQEVKGDNSNCALIIQMGQLKGVLETVQIQ